MDDELSGMLTALGVGLLVVAIIVFFLMSMGAITAPWAEQIRTDTRQQSESYLEGTLSDFEELCLNMDTATDGQRATYANVIFQRSGRVTDEVLAQMPASTQRCIRDARAILVEQAK